MEPRKITVIKAAGQGKITFVSNAETLGQLKGNLIENNINFDDMTFYVAIAKVELLDDSSVLPTNLPYKGETTNELVIMLTLKNKKIKSGSDRTDAFEYIKANGLGDAIKLKFDGKNYTQVKTEDLLKFVDGHKNSKQGVSTTASKASKKNPATPVVKVEEIVPVAKKEAKKPAASKEVKASKATVKSVLTAIVGLLFGAEVIADDEYDTLVTDIASIDDHAVTESEGKVVAKVEELTSSYSDAELREFEASIRK